MPSDSPSSQNPAEGDAEGEGANLPGPPAKWRALVVDDDPRMRLPCAAALKLMGYEVETADDGAAGLEALARTPFHLIVSDYEMPNLNGLEFAREASRRGDRIPFILMSGSLADQPPQTGEAPGIWAFIAKPFGVQQLRDALRRLGLPCSVGPQAG